MGLSKRKCLQNRHLRKESDNRHRTKTSATSFQKIPKDVFRKKSYGEYNCTITKSSLWLPTNVETLRRAGRERFGHLQRKKKSQKLSVNRIKSMFFEDLSLKETETCFDNRESLFENECKENDKKLQCSEVKSPFNLSTLWEDLFSLRNFRLRPVEFQCYLLTQTVVQHPKHVHGIQWENFKYEMFRLATFSTYPTIATKSVLILARDGFVYFGDGSDDKVICYSCCVTKNNWLVAEDVSEVHKRLSIGCSMVTGKESNNIPVKAGSQAFEKVLHNLSLLNIDEGYNSIENEKEALKQYIETDAAPLTTQEQTHRNFERTRLTANGEISQKSLERSMVASGSPNNTPGRSNPVLFSNYRNATVEHAYIVMPPSANPAQHPPTLSNDSSGAQAAEIQNQTSTQAGNSQPISYNNTNSTPSNIAANSERASPNQAAADQPKHSRPPNTHAGKSKDGKGPTYSELGIITERPKRKEYALKVERFKTFASWSPSHHIKSDDLAEAGFYYAGYGDCARCFFCGGGLRNWEDEDDVWVEHARWFPKCAFIRQLMGQNFVDAVQELNKIKDKISFPMVTDAMGCSASAYLIGSKTNPLLRDPAVKAMIEFGHNDKTVLEIASDLKSKDVQLSADLLLTKLKETCSPQSLESSTPVSTEDQELIRQIKEKNNMMRQQTMCKICMDKDVEVVFLPCGHLVCCAECANALSDCPVCRKPVKGTVRAFTG